MLDLNTTISVDTLQTVIGNAATGEQPPEKSNGANKIPGVTARDWFALGDRVVDMARKG